MISFYITSLFFFFCFPYWLSGERRKATSKGCELRYIKYGVDVTATKELCCSIFPSFWCAACLRYFVRHPQRSCHLLERVIYISFILASPHSGLSTCSPSPHMHRGWMWEVYVMGSGANCAVTCWNLAHLRRKKNLFIRPEAFVLLLECEGSVYQKQYPTLSWQINSYKLTSWGRPLYRLWWKKKSKRSFWKDAPNKLDVKLVRAAQLRDLWTKLSLMQKAPMRHETVMEVQWKCSLHASSPPWY